MRLALEFFSQTLSHAIVASESRSGLVTAQALDFAQTRARLLRNASKNGAQSTRPQNNT
jgi:hypothetical protein